MFRFLSFQGRTGSPDPDMWANISGEFLRGAGVTSDHVPGHDTLSGFPLWVESGWRLENPRMQASACARIAPSNFSVNLAMEPPELGAFGWKNLAT